MRTHTHAMRTFVFRAMLIAMILPAGSTVAQPPLPEGPAAKQFAAWLAAFNKGDRAGLLAYHEQSLPYAVASADVAGIDRELGLSAGTGGFDVVKTETVSATTFTAVMKERRSD